ncbi:hypothetical protein [Paenibacillus sp. N3.4]|uniref:hypothetical protein n=1 Tax=Paenibacillus sp. N3.4 TaxID=2603222 RepID=UPI0011C99F15|nr:hypothetical protein [Paenibacillus sp. N3.4]TXK76011.1 hypothetical protein FU659_26610 [Paenibacillus sp. N3.4]
MSGSVSEGLACSNQTAIWTEEEVQSQMTARVADALYLNVFPNGVYHIDQLFDLDALPDKVLEDVSVEMRINGIPYRDK